MSFSLVEPPSVSEEEPEEVPLISRCDLQHEKLCKLSSYEFQRLHIVPLPVSNLLMGLESNFGTRTQNTLCQSALVSTLLLLQDMTLA